MLRIVEGLDVTETSAVLDLGSEAVKSRSHCAGAMLRKDLHRRAGIEAMQTFAFLGVQCDRVVADVFERIANRYGVIGRF